MLCTKCDHENIEDDNDDDDYLEELFFKLKIPFWKSDKVGISYVKQVKFMTFKVVSLLVTSIGLDDAVWANLNCSM